MADDKALARASKQPYDLVPPSSIRNDMVTTAFILDGFRIRKNLGVVRGIVVRSRSLIGNIGAGFQMLFGGNITVYTKLCEHARQEAFDILLRHAAEVGANAIIGMRYDATEFSQGATEVLAHGTAVRLDRL